MESSFSVRRRTSVAQNQSEFCWVSAALSKTQSKYKKFKVVHSHNSQAVEVYSAILSDYGGWRDAAEKGLCWIKKYRGVAEASLNTDTNSCIFWHHPLADWLSQATASTISFLRLIPSTNSVLFSAHFSYLKTDLFSQLRTSEHWQFSGQCHFDFLAQAEETQIADKAPAACQRRGKHCVCASVRYVWVMSGGKHRPLPLSGPPPNVWSERKEGRRRAAGREKVRGHMARDFTVLPFLLCEFDLAVKQITYARTFGSG